MAELTQSVVYTVPDWTPARVRSVLTGADSGQIANAMDLCEAMLLDDHISGVLSTRVLSMLGLPLIFEGTGTTCDALRGDGRHDGDWWRMFPENELAGFATWAVIAGVALGERVESEPGPSGRSTPRLKVWHPRFLTRNSYTGAWLLQTRDTIVEIQPGDGQWILYTSNETAPWKDGAWRSLWLPWLVKQYAIRDWQRFSETSGSPARVGSAPEGASRSDIDKYGKDIKSISRDTGIALPHGWDMKLVEAMGKGETFGALIEWANRASEVCLVGQVTTTEGSMGFSSGTNDAATRRQLVKYTAESISTCLHYQAIVPWVIDNFGSGESVPWQTWDTAPQEDQQSKAKTMESLGQAIVALDGALATSGARVDGAAIAQSFQIATVQLPPNKSEAPSVTLAPTDIAKIVKVNEGRASAGLGPMLLPNGQPDPDGEMSIAAYSAKTDAAAASPPPAPNPSASPFPSAEPNTTVPA